MKDPKVIGAACVGQAGTKGGSKCGALKSPCLEIPLPLTLTLVECPNLTGTEQCTKSISPTLHTGLPISFSFLY